MEYILRLEYNAESDTPCSLPLANFLKFRLSQSYRNVIELPLVGFYSSSCLAVLGTKKTERCISSDVIMSTVFSHQVKKEIPEVKFDDVPDVSDFDIQKMKT